MGDRILKVNGSDVTSATHQEAVMELLRPCDDIQLTIQHDPLPAGFQVIIKSSQLHSKLLAFVRTQRFVSIKHKVAHSLFLSSASLFARAKL